MPILLTLIATFLWLDFGRRQIRRVWASVENRTLDLMVLTLVAISVVLPIWPSLVSEYDNRQLQAALHEAKQQILESNERESLRRWAMVTSKGEEAKDVLGVQSYGSKGPMAERHRKVFIRKEDGRMHFAGPLLCNDTAYVNEVLALIRDFPKAPYAYVALTWCLKHHGDQAWRGEGERTRDLLEKLMKIQPHVMEIDSFYGFLIRFIFEEKIEDTGYFTVGEGGVYIPAGTP
jgi:hypothetical protein